MASSDFIKCPSARGARQPLNQLPSSLPDVRVFTRRNPSLFSDPCDAQMNLKTCASPVRSVKNLQTTRSRNEPANTFQTRRRCFMVGLEGRFPPGVGFTRAPGSKNSSRLVILSRRELWRRRPRCWKALIRKIL